MTGDTPRHGTDGGPGVQSGGGELGALIRVHDWSKTPLGQPAGWPQSLKSGAMGRLGLGTRAALVRYATQQEWL